MPPETINFNATEAGIFSGDTFFFGTMSNSPEMA
jgi:hypothetical protein